MLKRFINTLGQSRIPFLLWLITGVMLHTASAQTRPEVNNRSTGRVGYMFMYDQLIEPAEYPIQGTPYMDDDYRQGQLHSDIGKLTEMNMRYNIYFDRMEYRKMDTVYVIEPNLLIDKVVIGDQSFVVENYETKDGVYPSFFLRLDSGKVSLLTKMEVAYRERQQGKPIQGDIPAKYDRMPDVNYLKLNDGSLKKISSIKKLIQSLPDHRSEMEKFAREYKISAKNEAELTKFTRYYNTLE